MTTDIFLPVTPVSKPRQTKSDKWKKRPAVLRYRAFADEVRLRLRSTHTDLDLNGKVVTFCMLIPESWSRKKRLAYIGSAHRQKPDLDNLAKALFDALYEDDSSIHNITLSKVWSLEQGIHITGP